MLVNLLVDFFVNCSISEIYIIKLIIMELKY